MAQVRVEQQLGIAALSTMPREMSAPIRSLVRIACSEWIPYIVRKQFPRLSP